MNNQVNLEFIVTSVEIIVKFYYSLLSIDETSNKGSQFTLPPGSSSQNRRQLDNDDPSSSDLSHSTEPYTSKKLFRTDSFRCDAT